MSARVWSGTIRRVTRPMNSSASTCALIQSSVVWRGVAQRYLAVLDAKAGVLVGYRVALGVLLPQQHQRDAGTLEFLVNDSEVGSQLVAGAGHRWAIQPGFKGLFAEGLGDIPVDTGRAGQRDVFAHHTPGDLERAPDLVVAQLGLQVQAQCLSDSAHSDSVGWHRVRTTKSGEPEAG